MDYVRDSLESGIVSTAWLSVNHGTDMPVLKKACWQIDILAFVKSGIAINCYPMIKIDFSFKHLLGLVEAVVCGIWRGRGTTWHDVQCRFQRHAAKD